MNKRTHRNRDSYVENDKPGYAADYPVKKAKAEKAGDEHAHVKEHLQGNVVNKLNRLKATLQEEASAKSDKQKSKRSPNSGSVTNRGAKAGKQASETPDENKSFAELFAPEEEEDVTFEDMLKDSKLDWRKFK